MAGVLAYVTYRYMTTTEKILEESRKTREAAEQQAAANRENLDLLKREYERRLGQSPQILSETLRSTRALIDYREPMSLARDRELPAEQDQGQSVGRRGQRG